MYSFDRIFVVGFPKCGTSSLQYSLEASGIESLHWADLVNFTDLAGMAIKKAKQQKLPLLTYVNKYRAFTQMETCIDENMCYWPQLLDVPLLEEQYPNSKFIFNDRDVSRWIRSVTHWNAGSLGNLRTRLTVLDIPGLPKGAGAKDSELENWYVWHKKKMINHFKGKDNFIVFDIEKDPDVKLGSFLGIDNFNFYHKNSSGFSFER